MKDGLILSLALLLSGILFGCTGTGPRFTDRRERRACENVTSAINRRDWNALRRLTRSGMRANDYIVAWEKNPARVGKLLQVDRGANYYPDGKPCTIYTFAWDSKDNPHKLQILVREENGKVAILDFWNFGW